MSESNLNVVSSLESIRLMFWTDPKLNSYVRTIVKDTWIIIVDLYRSKIYLIPTAMLFLYKIEIRPRMEFWCHVLAGDTHSSLYILEFKSNWQLCRGLIIMIISTRQPLSFRRNDSSLSHFFLFPWQFFKRSTVFSHNIPNKKAQFSTTSFPGQSLSSTDPRENTTPATIILNC